MMNRPVSPAGIVGIFQRECHSEPAKAAVSVGKRAVSLLQWQNSYISDGRAGWNPPSGAFHRTASASISGSGFRPQVLPLQRIFAATNIVRSHDLATVNVQQESGGAAWLPTRFLVSFALRAPTIIAPDGATFG